MDKENNSPARAFVSAAAIDPYIEQNIISPVEKKAGNGDMVEWGAGNQYPLFLKELYGNVTTLRTIICGDVDFVAGDQVTLGAVDPTKSSISDGTRMNRKGGSLRDQVKDLARDLDLFGGFALQVIRDKSGKVAELYYIPMDYLRSDADNEVFYYSEKWAKRGPKNVLVYPKYADWAVLDEEGRAKHAASILYVKSNHDGTYPQPKYAAAVKACQLERCIDDYHLNAISNDFEASAIINFNNGIPSDEMKEEISAEIDDVMGGYQNARRIIKSWNPNKDSQTTIAQFPVQSFGEKYKALAEHSRQQIFCAFRAVPSLFGLPTASGFSTEEYEAAFKLYNRTQVQPMQRLIVEAYERLLGPGCVVIKPFSLDGETEDNIQ